MNTLERWIIDNISDKWAAEVVAMHALRKQKIVHKKCFWAKDATEAECVEAVAFLSKKSK